MNYFIPVLLNLLFLFQASLAQKHIADGDRVIRGNRLISVRSIPGQQLAATRQQFDNIEIDIDAKMSEEIWNTSQTIGAFIDSTGKQEKTNVNVLFDQEKIVLFWSVYEQDAVTAGLQEHDGIITNDDYVQINLQPWLPDSIKWAREYYYSIAINANGIVWDSYYDPYGGGYFFSSWNSHTKVATLRKGNQWFVEMVIPFSGLDHSSNPGWTWKCDFLHASYLESSQKVQLYKPQIGVTVEQGIMVRRDPLVEYYWPRPEFMQEVKPKIRTTSIDDLLPVVELEKVPAINGKADKSIWGISAWTRIDHTDRMGIRLNEDIAQAKVGFKDNVLCFRLEADGAKIDPGLTDTKVTGKGMHGQMAGVNGVFKDDALFAHECFWLLVQPRDPNLDNIHQKYYLITINNRGELGGIQYDQFGAPDRSWQADGTVDLFNTASGWGVEVMLPLSSIDVPVGCGDIWGLNIFRNRVFEIADQRKTELQTWLYTAGDYLNPATMGNMAHIRIDTVDAIKPGLQRKVVSMQEKLKSYSKKHNKLIASLVGQINSLKYDSINELVRCQQILEKVDHELGTIDVQDHFHAFEHPAKGGYPLMDVQFIGDKGWAVGAMGTILRSEDGGKSWQSVNIQADVDLYRVCFVNSSEGWAAGGRIRMAAKNEDMQHDKRGGYGYIFHTKDGGKTWENQYGERGRHLFGLAFVNEHTGYAVGERGFLLKTVDSGQHWSMLATTGTQKWLYGIDFRDESFGVAVGESEIVIKTTDGGLTWTKMDAAADRKFYQFRPFYRDVTFHGTTGCIVGQNGSIVISHDGGETWKPTATFLDTKIRELLDLRSIHFVTPSFGYAVGELGTQMMVTEDGGKSWALRPIANTDWLRSVWADTEGRIIAVGEREKILRSENMGFNWQVLHGNAPKSDVMVLLAHGDDSPIHLNAFLAHYTINEGKQIVDIGVMSDVHSSEYEETYNLEHDRDVWMSGVRTSTNFNEFENGNNGCDYYHFTERLWEGEENVVRHMVAAIRAYRPDVVIVHGPVFGDYDKPGHKVSGRAGIPAFETSGGEVDLWPQLTRLGLEPWQAKKLYCLASESYPMTLDLTSIGSLPLTGTQGTCMEWAEYVIRNFQSQGVYHARNGKLCLIKSLVNVPQIETSVFDGL